jgi:hypothetical protein
MLTNSDLDNMERLIGFTGALPKREARQLIKAYREILDSAPHVVTEGKSKNRRKKNEPLDKAQKD